MVAVVDRLEGGSVPVGAGGEQVGLVVVAFCVLVSPLHTPLRISASGGGVSSGTNTPGNSKKPSVRGLQPCINIIVQPCLQKPLIGIQSWDVDWFRVLLQLSLMIAPYGYLMNCQNDFRNMDYYI